jgi:ATP-dependent helicase HrpA
VDPAAEAWTRAAHAWERYDLTSWPGGDLPEPCVVASVAGLPLHGHLGFQVEADRVNLRLFRTRDEAQQASRDGYPRLAALALQRELAWTRKDLRALSRLHGLYVTLGPAAELEETAWENLRRHLFPAEPLPPFTARAFTAYVDRARHELPGLATRLVDHVQAILEKRQVLLLQPRPFRSLRAELDALVPSRFLVLVPFTQLHHLPRYLDALRIRAERAALNPVKDAERQRRVEPYVKQVQARLAAAAPGSDQHARAEAFRWLVEEFKVSCFAQELGTAVPVSEKRLDAYLSRV